MLLFQEMKYHIDKVPTHPLHIDCSFNQNFGEDIKDYLEKEKL